MPTPPNPAPRRAAEETEDRLPPKVSAAKGGAGREDDFGDFNEEDFDDDFDDDFEEEMDDEYDLAEIEGEIDVEELDDEDIELADLPLVEKIVKDDDEAEDGFDDAEPVADPEEEEEFEDEAE